MKENQNTYDKIEAYLKRRMSLEERLAFEKQMQEDEDLAQEVAMQKAFIDVLKAEDIRATLKALKPDQKIEETMDQPSESPSKEWPKSIVYILGLIIVFVICFLVFIPSWFKSSDRAEAELNIKNTDTLQDSTFITDSIDRRRIDEVPPIDKSGTSEEAKKPPVIAEEKLPPAPEGESNEKILAMAEELHNRVTIRKLSNTKGSSQKEITGIDSILNEALSAYKRSDFQEANRILNSVPDYNPQYSLILPWLAHVAFQTNDFAKAKDLYSIMMQDDNNTLQAEEAQYFYLLTLLALGEEQSPAFKEVYTAIEKMEYHSYHNMIDTIKAKLRN